MQAIINGKIVTETKVILDHVLVFDEKIQQIVDRAAFKQTPEMHIIDAQGQYIAPGFINQHVHGCDGFDTMDVEPESLAHIAQCLAQTGVTSFLPTTMTYDFATIYQSLKMIRENMQLQHGAEIIGCHMEGPFINKDYKGAHDAQYIVPPDFELIKDYIDVIKIITVAPEVIKDEVFIEKCKAAGIILSLGHSGASYEEAIAAIKNGISHVTHICNALPALHHRQPGVIGAALDSDAMCELIADNVHVHPAMQRIIWKAKGTDHIVLVTDSMRACMLRDGEYELGGQPVFVKDKVARLENGVIAGSVLMMDQAVKIFKENTKVSLCDAIKTVTINPAKELGIYARKGSLDVGKQADIIVFDENIGIKATFVKGKAVFRRK